MNNKMWLQIKKAAEESLKHPGRNKKPLPKDSFGKGDNYVVVFRHGESEDNVKRIFSGWRDDTKLTQVGIEQAKKLAPKLKDIPLDVVITSDQVRSKETAKYALKYHPNIKWEEDWRIKERNYGDLNGQSKIEWMKKDYEQTIKWRRGYDTPPPNGESLKMVVERVYPFLDELVERVRREHINVALSVHGNSMRAIRKYFEGMSILETITHENPLGEDYALYVVSRH